MSETKDTKTALEESAQSTDLVLKGKELGQAILAESIKQLNKKATDSMLEYAGDLQLKIVEARKYLDALQADYDAINNGEFKVNQGQLVFDDPKRGQAYTFGRAVTSCPRCGSRL